MAFPGGEFRAAIDADFQEQRTSSPDGQTPVSQGKVPRNTILVFRGLLLEKFVESKIHLTVQ